MPLKNNYPQLAVYGPKETQIKGADHLVDDGQQIQINQMVFSVLAIPGHTLGHVAYYHAPFLFCGDTLFSAGCGRVFEGSNQQLYHSLQCLAALPDDTQVCCGHEYTLSNLQFAASILPHDQQIQDHLIKVEEMRQRSQNTLPSLLSQEKKSNIFLRCDDPAVAAALSLKNTPLSPNLIFAELRNLKNKF